MDLIQINLNLTRAEIITISTTTKTTLLFSLCGAVLINVTHHTHPSRSERPSDDDDEEKKRTDLRKLPDEPDGRSWWKRHNEIILNKTLTSLARYLSTKLQSNKNTRQMIPLNLVLVGAGWLVISEHLLKQRISSQLGLQCTNWLTLFMLFVWPFELGHLNTYTHAHILSIGHFNRMEQTFFRIRSDSLRRIWVVSWSCGFVADWYWYSTVQLIHCLSFTLSTYFSIIFYK